MKTSEIKREARELINDVFYKAIESEDKGTWRYMISFVKEKVAFYERGERGEKMFIWRSILGMLTHKYGKKFLCDAEKNSILQNDSQRKTSESSKLCIKRS